MLTTQTRRSMSNITSKSEIIEEDVMVWDNLVMTLRSYLECLN